MSANFQRPSTNEIRAVLRRIVGRRIAVVGDAMLDAYVIGDVGRISPEAPVPVLTVEREEYLLGGAANVAKCLVALGAKVRLCAVIGDDRDGMILQNEARSLGIETGGLVIDPQKPTIRKTRIVARHQQVIRLDREPEKSLGTRIEKRLLTQISKAAKWADAVVLSDYDKGALSNAVCRGTIRAAAKTPVLVDPKALPWKRFRGATLIKPNVNEAQSFAAVPLGDERALERCARKIASEIQVRHVLVTRGPDGMLLSAGDAGPKAAPRRRTIQFDTRHRDLIDVTGAGDVVAAALAGALGACTPVELAAYLANVAAGVKVGKFGAAAVTGQEILESLDDGGDDRHKILTRKQAVAFANRHRKGRRTVVFTNGCFDLLHAGHVSYLQRSRREGDVLIVGLNTDASVERLKGPARPVQNERDRAHILASLSCVDAVVLFDEDTPLELIKALRPNVLSKGTDYKTKRNVVGWKTVEANGGRVALIDLVEGLSTTRLIKKAGR